MIWFEEILRPTKCQEGIVRKVGEGMSIEEVEREIKELQSKIDIQTEINIKLYKSIPAGYACIQLNKEEKDILEQWRKGAEKLKDMLKRLNNLKDLRHKLRCLDGGFAK